MTVSYISVPLRFVERQIDKTQPVFYDCETTDLYTEVVLAQFMQPSWTEALVVETPNYEQLQQLIKDLHIVCYPISYDIGLLEIQPKKIDCLQVASKSAYPLSDDFKLSTIAPHIFYKVDKKAMQKSFTKHTKALTEEQLHYGALDVFALKWLWEQDEIQNILTSNLSYRVDMKNQWFALNYQHNGMPVIASAWKKAKENTEDTKAVCQADLNEIVGFDINVKSFAQKQKAFPELPTDPKTGKTPTGEPAFKKLYLETEEEKYNLVIKTTKARTQLQDLEKYRQSYIPNEEPVRIRTFFNVAGAITGRYASSGGARIGYTNIQNIGRHFKSIFGYEEIAKRTIVSADYGQAELICAASIHNISAYVEAVLAGDDLHKSGYSKMFGIPIDEVTKEQRQKFKAIAFGLIFGLGVERFQAYAYDSYGVKLTQEECIEIKRLYYEVYPEIARWHKLTAKQIKGKNFVVKTAMGRIVHPDRYADALNIAIQGSVAEATKMAINFLHEDYPHLFEKGVMVINMVHDSIVLDCPDDMAEEASKCLEGSMKLGWNELSKCKLFKVKLPIGVDIDIARRWK